MAYNPNIPQPTDIPANSQSQVLDNFGAINSVFGVNHATFGAPNEGKHNFLQMPEVSGSVTTAMNEAALYSAVGATSAQAELVFKRETPAVSGVLPQTIAFTECVAPNADNSDGWTALPSGIVIKWGSATLMGGTAVVTFTPSFSKWCYNVQITNKVGNSAQQNWVNVDSTTVTKTGFTVHAYTKTSSGANTDVYYLAIGV